MRLTTKALRQIIKEELRSVLEGEYMQKSDIQKMGSRISNKEYAMAEEYCDTYFKDMQYIGRNFRHRFDDARMYSLYYNEREQRAMRCTEDTGRGAVCWYVLGPNPTDGFVNPETGMINYGPNKGQQIFDPGEEV